MSEKIELPSGGWVQLRDPKSLKHGDRAKLYKGVDSSMSEAERGILMSDRIIAVLIEDWSFDLLIPSVRFESIGEMDIPDYDLVAEHAQEATLVLFPQLRKTVENEADPKVPTADFND